MREAERSWDEYRRCTMEPDTPDDVLEVMKMAYLSGRLSGLADVGETCKRDAAWKRLTRDALAASREQADAVLDAARREEAEEARWN